VRLATHIAGGVLGYTVAATFFQVPWTATGVVVASAAAAAPDVDTLGSTVGRVFAPVARRIERRFGHRTITHCYAAQGAVALLALPLLWTGAPWEPLPHLYAAVVVGYLSHPFLDTWTVQGVRVFWPWSDRRGVFPYYNRQETAYRTRTGSRADTFFGLFFVCATVPFAVVQVDGYQRLVRRVQADASAAVRDFLDWSADGYLVSIEVVASDPQHLRRLEGRFEAVGTTGAGTLLVRDSTDGRVFSLGPAYSANFQPDRVVAHRGPRVSVSRRQIRLDGRVLADLESLVPTRADGLPLRHLIDGQVTVTEPAGVTPDDFRFNTVTGTDRRLSFQFATLGDLDRLGLSGLVVETGSVTLRVFTRAGEAEDYDPDDAQRSAVRRVSFAHKPSEPPRLLVREGQTVAVGDTLAILTSAAVTTAALDVAEAQADLAAAQAEAVPSSYDPVSLRQRLADAERAARRVEARHAEGFEPAAAVDAARAEVADLRGQLAHAEAGAGDWQRARAGRVREASARLRRALVRQRTAVHDGVVRSTGAGVVQRIERHERGPDRSEVRVVLTSPRLSPTGGVPRSGEGGPSSSPPPRR
jgi:inner membrane protein